MNSSLPRHVVANPTGNITVLVTEPVPAEEHPSVAARFFAAVPSCEQVGFISLFPEEFCVSIRMSGGEFCGNATLSAAAFACREFGCSSGEITVLFDGIASPLLVSVNWKDSSSYSGIVRMPLPMDYGCRSFSFGALEFSLPVVRFPGISHVILKEELSREVAERAVKQWCHQLDVPALGLMLLRDDSLTPLVYVRDVDTLYWEHSCASGTCAAAWVAFSNSGEPFSGSFHEPSGVLSAEAGPDFLRLIGNVSFLT